MVAARSRSLIDFLSKGGGRGYDAPYDVWMPVIHMKRQERLARQAPTEQPPPETLRRKDCRFFYVGSGERPFLRPTEGEAAFCARL